MTLIEQRSEPDGWRDIRFCKLGAACTCGFFTDCTDCSNGLSAKDVFEQVRREEDQRNARR